MFISDLTFKQSPLSHLVIGIGITILFINPSIASENVGFDNALACFQKAEYTQSRMLFTQISNTQLESDSAYYYLGKSCYHLNQLDTAIKYYQKALVLKPDNAEFYYCIGQAYARKLQDSHLITQARLAPKVLEAFSKAVALDSTHMMAQIGLSDFYRIAPAYAGGNLDKSITHAEAIRNLNESRCRLLLAQVYYKQGYISRAETEYSIIETQTMDSTLYQSAMGHYGDLLFDQKHYSEAYEKYRKRLDYSPKSIEAWIQLGRAFEALNRINDAKNAYQQAILINPKHQEANERFKAL